MISDPIADLLTRIRNSNQRHARTVSIPYSNIKNEIVKIFLDEGYIEDFKIKEITDVKKDIVVQLKYKGKQPVITNLKRISKPGLRVYQGASELPNVLNGFGTAIVSTSNGLMTGKQAKAKSFGGEVMLYIW